MDGPSVASHLPSFRSFFFCRLPFYLFSFLLCSKLRNVYSFPPRPPRQLQLLAVFLSFLNKIKEYNKPLPLLR